VFRTNLSPPIYNVTFPKFDENDSLNQKNNNSTSSSSGYVSNLTNINSPPMLFSPVLSHHGLEQHLNPANVFPLLSPLSVILSHLLIVDSPCTNTKFEKLLLHFVYRSLTSSPSPSSPNSPTDSSMSSKEFAACYELSLHVFSSSSSHYYSLH
jgi:hypothetical protein